MRGRAGLCGCLCLSGCLLSLLYTRLQPRPAPAPHHQDGIARALALERFWAGPPQHQARARVLVVSSWRSGSSYLAALLASGPASLLWYEPLARAGQRVVAGKAAEPHLNTLRNLLSCSFSNLTAFLQVSRS